VGRVDDFVNNYDEIIRIVTKVRGESLGPEFYLDYASVCSKNGKDDIAERILKNCVSLFPDSATVLNYIAYTWAENGINFEQALTYAKRAVEKEPENGAFADTLGWVYYGIGDYKNALKELTRAVELMPGDPTVVEHLGDVYFSLNNIDKAIERWSSALIYSPDNSGLILKLTEQNVNIELLIEKSHEMKKKSRE
jgi:tetratricopeptide (TPR) repeat protein